MTEVNESNVAIKLKHTEEIIFEEEDSSVQSANAQIDPHITPIITENVPFTNKNKDISKWYIGTNIFLNINYLILILVITLTSSELGRAFVIAITVSSYLVYLVVAYHYSSLLPLTNLQSIHQYRPIFQQMTLATCHLIFRYTSSRNNIDQTAKIHEKQYQNVRIQDRSGVLYNVSKDHEIIFVKYHKKYYFRDNLIKTKVHEDFSEFIQKCKKEGEPQHGKFLLRGKERIELIVEGMMPEMGFYVHEEQCFKFAFYLTLLTGLAVYYEYYIQRKILRYEIDILKELGPQ